MTKNLSPDASSNPHWLEPQVNSHDVEEPDDTLHEVLKALLECLTSRGESRTGGLRVQIGSYKGLLDYRISETDSQGARGA